ncbi:MAG: glutathione peroxidase [Alphaproteobacteria bacterium]|nr:glutathione peroxidase [Alphaproteobacteria bacterium]
MVQPAEQVLPAELVQLDGQPMPKATLEGKVVLFVNVASKCGFTRQYDGLQALYAKYRDQGLVVVGAPCNQFGAQEPGSPEEIATFCRMTYGVEFPMLEKQDVNGPERSALYTKLVASPAGGGKDIGWNFEKFLVGRDGRVIARFDSKTEPDAAELVSTIEKALAAKK